MKLFGGLIIVAAIALVQGRSTPGQRVADGTLAALGEHPHTVHIRYVTPTGTLDSCAGSLINPRWVLTAASCVAEARFIWLRYGVVNVANPELVTEAGAASIRIHPGFDGMKDNIALISVNRDVSSTSNIQTIRLESSSEAEENNVGKESVFCAWGNTENGEGLSENLVCANLITADSVTCTNSLTPADIIDNIVCAVGTGTCSGDTGGPLVVRDEEGFKQIGVLSYGPSRCIADAPFSGAFTRTGKYISWIEAETSLSFDSTATKKVPELVQVAYL